jgi:lipopolysaccharide export system protein LptC
MVEVHKIDPHFLEPARPRGRANARRYRWLRGAFKLLLPFLALALVALVAIWPHLSLNPSLFTVKLSDVIKQSVDAVNMLNPRYSGVDDQDRPFTVIADSATQQPQDLDRVELARPRAVLSLDSGANVTLSADRGSFLRGTEKLDLTGEVHVIHDQGYDFRTEEARLDIKAGTAAGDQPVQGSGGFGTLSAEGFRIFDQGALVIFTGKAKVTLPPGAQAPEKTDVQPDLATPAQKEGTVP